MATSGGSVEPVGPLPVGRSRAEMVTEVRVNLAALPRGATVVVACSGGPDSSALAHLTADARPDLTLLLAQIAHGLRDGSAERVDRDVVATHAAWLGAELIGCDLEVVSSGRGIEAAARDARYRALRAVAASRDAAAILVGHSADDQAETVLLRIARGTGIDGLAAMAITAGDLVRPLLRLRRDDLHAFVAGEGLPTATDETNEDDAIRRVRVRREVLPALQRIGPDPVGTLGRLAVLARDDAAALAEADAAVSDAFRRVGPVVALRSEALTSVPIAIARRVVRRAMAVLVDRPPSAATVARILGAPVGDAATLPGGVEFRAERAWRTLVLAEATGADRAGTADRPGGADGTCGADGVGRPEQVVGAGGRSAFRESDAEGGSHLPSLELSAAAPGRQEWSPAGLVLRLLVPSPDGSTLGSGDESQGDHDADPRDPGSGGQIALSLPGVWAPPRHRVAAGRNAPGTDADRYAVTLPGGGGGLVVRAIVAGDRIRGPGGTRRVVDVLRDAGMPRAIRARWPVVEELGGRGRVVWIPGVAVDAERSVAGRLEPALAIQATPQGGRLSVGTAATRVRGAADAPAIPR